MPLNSSSADLGASASGRTSRRGSDMAREVLLSSGTNKIADSEGNTFDPVGSTAGNPRESFLKIVGDNVKEKVGSMIGEKALDPAAAAELQAKNPGAVAFLSSTSGVVLEMVIFLTYVGLDMGKKLYNGYVLHSSGLTLVVSSLIILMGIVQCSLALASIGFIYGKEGFKMLADPVRYRKFALVSFLFSLAQQCSTLAYTELSPGTISILGQCRLLETAILSKIIFNRRYIETQWLLMSIIIFGAVLHLMAKQSAEDIFKLQGNLNSNHAERHSCLMDLQNLNWNFTTTTTTTTTTWADNTSDNTSDNMSNTSGDLVKKNASWPSDCIFNPPEDHTSNEGMILGIFYTFLYFFCSDVASIVSEMFLKSEKDTPFYIQKATMESMGIPILFTFSFISPWFQKVAGTSASRWAPQMWWATEGGNFFGSAAALEWCNNPNLTHHHVVGPFPGGCGRAAGGLFRAWDHAAPYGALIVASGQSWFAGILVKLMSSVVKLLAKLISLGGVFFIGDCWLLRDSDAGNLLPAGVAAIQVMLLTYTFLSIKVPKDEPKDEPQSKVVEMPQRPANA